jgi:SAM-dependent methyltransferase
MSLARRHRHPELMDDPALDPAEHRRALAGLARINAVSGSVDVLWPAIRQLVAELNRPVKVLDIATGAGDVPAELYRRAVRAGLPIEFAGSDISPVALEVASRAGSPVRFFPLDAIKDRLPTGFDVFTCSLFLHHLDSPDAVTLLRKLREANPRLILVNDLERSRFNYAAVWAASRLFSRSRVVHADGPLSIRGAFTVNEMRAMAAAAGLTGARVRAKFPCRLLLEWRGAA